MRDEGGEVMRCKCGRDVVMHFDFRDMPEVIHWPVRDLCENCSSFYMDFLKDLIIGSRITLVGRAAHDFKGPHPPIISEEPAWLQ